MLSPVSFFGSPRAWDLCCNFTFDSQRCSKVLTHNKGCECSVSVTEVGWGGDYALGFLDPWFGGRGSTFCSSFAGPGST